MNTIRILAGAALLAAVMVAALPAQEAAPAPRPDRPQARPRRHAPGIGQDRPGAPAYSPHALIARREFLALSDQQVSRMEALAEGVRSVRERAAESVQQHRDALQEAWQADQPDVSAIRRHAEALYQAQHEVRLAELTAAAEAKGLLTAEQQGKLRGWMDGWRRAARGGRAMRAGPTFRGRAFPGRPGFRRPARPLGRRRF